MLSIRLQTIADFIPKNSQIIDIGCDHAYLDIYLTKIKNCQCIASDINKKCILKALENIKKNQLEDKIKLVVTDGLNNIDYDNNSYIIISGMGFQTIKKILTNHYPSNLVIQSNTEIEELKRELYKRYIVVKEKVVFDRNKYYTILFLKKGKQRHKKFEYIIGLDNNIDYIKHLYNKYSIVYNNLPKKYILKRIKIKKRIKLLNKYIKKH